MLDNVLVPNKFLSTKFAQQRLPAFRPIVTPLVAIIGSFIICVLSFILGSAFYISYKNLPEYSVRYDDQVPVGSSGTVKINVEKDIKGDVLIYYKLTKFYQNHRKFMESRDYYQLAGEYREYSDLSSCKPLRSINDSDDPADLYLPCGLAPMTVFNDTFDVDSLGSSFTRDGIAWKADKKYLYKNLSSEYTEGQFWLSEGIYADLFPDAQNDERFISWMRFSTLSTLMKKWAICKGCVVSKGEYNITVTSSYPTSFFGGEKYFVISRTSGVGCKDGFLSYVYFFLGSISLALAVGLVVRQALSPRKPGDPDMLRRLL